MCFALNRYVDREIRLWHFGYLQWVERSVMTPDATDTEKTRGVSGCLNNLVRSYHMSLVQKPLSYRSFI